ncbi:MAG TPA: hypothetical protein VFS43_04230 [Polyangiaceae bacterium]|nr:hypothetical protein [Polyangiaceae bacterium]
MIASSRARTAWLARSTRASTPAGGAAHPGERGRRGGHEVRVAPALELLERVGERRVGEPDGLERSQDPSAHADRSRPGGLRDAARGGDRVAVEVIAKELERLGWGQERLRGVVQPFDEAPLGVAVLFARQHAEHTLAPVHVGVVRDRAERREEPRAQRRGNYCAGFSIMSDFNRCDPRS